MKPDLASTLPVHDHTKPGISDCGGCYDHTQPVARNAAQPAHDHGHDHHDHHGHDHDHGHAPVIAAPLDAQACVVATGRIVMCIEQMDCPTEERMIRTKLGNADDVVTLDSSLLERYFAIHHTADDVTPFLEALRAVDMDDEVFEQCERLSVVSVESTQASRRTQPLGVGGVTAFGAEAIAWPLGDHAQPMLALVLISITLAGGPMLYKGWIAVRAFTFNISFLTTVVVTGALLIGKQAEAAMVVFLFVMAEAIEACALVRARGAIRALTVIAPDTAGLADSADGQCDVVVDNVVVGTYLRVRTGSRVPVDARTVSGHVMLDESPVTGESLPVEKAVGDVVLASTIVTGGAVEAQVTAVAADNTLAHITGTIQQAQSQRAPTQCFVDKSSSTHTSVVTLSALAVAVIGSLATTNDRLAWTYRALVLLVTACLCALVISTPVTVVGGLAVAMRRGIVVKGGVYLESGRRLRALALDKTGTLTAGRPVLNTMMLSDGARRTAAALNVATDTAQLHALAVAAALGADTTHPVAVTIVQAAATHGIIDANSVQGLSVSPGRDAAGIFNGVRWHLGNAMLVAEHGFDTPDRRVAAEPL